MFDPKNKKTRFYIIGLFISLAVMLIVFYATDGLLGDKEFSEYTRDDWSIAILPLSIIAISAVSTLTFSLIIIIPLMIAYPAVQNYVANEKFANFAPETKFFAFDHNEFKRACCWNEGQNGVWFVVEEYDLKTRNWITLEEGRLISNPNDLVAILQKDYLYDEVKFYRINSTN